MREITRRRFLESSLLGTSALVAAGCSHTARDPDPISDGRVPLGRTGLRVPRIAMGSGTHGWKRASDQTRLGQEAFTRLAAHGVECGAAFFDTADLYGSHPFVKRAMEQLAVPRDELTILSKVWFAEAPEMTPTTTARPEVQRFLAELGTERLDICLIHCVQDPAWPTQLERMRTELSELKREGVIGAVGVSCHTHAALSVAAEHPWVDVILARINPAHKRMDADATTEEVAETLRAARARGKGVIGMKIFGCGDITAPEQRRASLAHAFEGGLVDCATIGFTDPAQIDDVLEQLGSLQLA